MAEHARLKPETLARVRRKLDASLDQTRQAIEGYIDHQTDESLLVQAREALRQISGTLRMVELYAAATLAQEMEEATRGLIDGALRNRGEILEMLLRAILQLPDYLEHAQAGNRDIPLALLPLIADFRTAREASLSTDKIQSFPQTANAPGADARRDSLDNDQMRALAKRLRRHYQVGLMGWFKDREARGNLEKLKSSPLSSMSRRAIRPRRGFGGPRRRWSMPYP